MKILLALIVSALPCLAANRTSLGEFKTTVGSPGQQTLLFEQITNQVELTIAMWVKYTWTDAQVNAQQGAGAFQGLISKGFFDTFALQFGMASSSEKLQFSFSSPSGTYHTWETTAAQVQTNTWMHIACSYTYSNSTSIALYVNGVPLGGSWVSGTGNAVAQTNTTPFHIDLYSKNGGSSFYVGAMSDLAVWTNSLNAGEISKLAKSRVKYMPLQIRPDKLKFFWPMDTKPIQPTIAGGDNFDVDRTQSHFNMDAGGKFCGERALSYQPNE